MEKIPACLTKTAQKVFDFRLFLHFLDRESFNHFANGTRINLLKINTCNKTSKKNKKIKASKKKCLVPLVILF